MVQIRSFAAKGPTTVDVIGGLSRSIGPSAPRANFVFAFYSSAHDDSVLHTYLRNRFRHARLIGGTSNVGVMNEACLWLGDAIGLLVIEDGVGNYGVAGAPKGANPAATAETLFKSALKDADRPDEMPQLVWVTQAPGDEERVIAGLRRAVGDSCPIVGGGSAGGNGSGQWRQMSTGRVMENGIVVGVLFPSGGVSTSFESFHTPSGPSGIATRASGRKIHTIDGRPSAHVYNEWIGGRLGDKARYGGTVIDDTALAPLGVAAEVNDGIARHLPVQPESVTADGSLAMLATVEQGARVQLLTSVAAGLVQATERVAAQAAAGLEGGASRMAGGLVALDGGCLQATDHPGDLVRSLAQGFAGKSFLGCFAQGQQGRLAGRNVHANLMISAIAFGA